MKRAISIFRCILEAERFHRQNEFFKSEVWFSLGVAQQHFGDFQESYHSFSTSLKFDRLNLRAHLNLAAVHHRYGSLEDASKSVKSIIDKRNLTYNLSSTPYQFVYTKMRRR